MNVVWGILCSFFVSLSLCAEEPGILPDEVVGSVQIWMQDTLDDWVFDAVGVDREALDESLSLAQEELKAATFTDDEPRREDAEALLQLLQTFEEQQPYASWLKSFLDRHPEPAAPPHAIKSLPDMPPTLQETRDRWFSILTNRPVPPMAQDFLPQIKPIFESEKIPGELVWVAEVESAFDPHAKSPVGAVGLFQLMPETAKSLGLSTWFPDERRNAEKNARAAAKYLQYLHDRFGDWQLALAAYNAGPTRVSKLLRKSDVYSYEAIAPQLPAETRDYVAKVEATLFLREGVELASLRASKG